MESLKNKISILLLLCTLVTCKLLAQDDANALEFIENKVNGIIQFSLKEC